MAEGLKQLVVEMIPPANDIEAQVTMQEDKLQVRPHFYSQQATVRVLYLQVVDGDGQVRGRHMLQISGKTGKIKLVECQPVTPQVLDPSAASAAVKK